MCTVVLLHRPNHPYPLILGANRDERRGRPWQPPARHWDDRPDVVAGLDELAGGTWLGLNDYGLVACVLNRPGTLGPQDNKRSRGELPLEALDHAEASVAADAISYLNTDAYRPFNMIIADARNAYWVVAREGRPTPLVTPIEAGLSMITAHDLNDVENSQRMRHYAPLFQAAKAPEPDSGDWSAWQALLSSPETAPDGGPESAMQIDSVGGFGTSSSSLIAIPQPPKTIGNPKVSAVWRFRNVSGGETQWSDIEI